MVGCDLQDSPQGCAANLYAAVEPSESKYVAGEACEVFVTGAATAKVIGRRVIFADFRGQGRPKIFRKNSDAIDV